MEHSSIENYLMGIAKAVGRIEGKLDGAPTHTEVFQAIDTHRLGCSRRPSLPGKRASSPLLKALIAALVALTGTVVALTQFLG